MLGSAASSAPAATITTPTTQDEDVAMAEDRRSPTARRRWLSRELAHLVREAGMDATKVDKALDWANGKTGRMLRDERKLPSVRDVRDILDLLQIGEDDPRREYLVTLAKQGRAKDWWQPYEVMLNDKFTAFLALETEADTEYAFEQGVFPGLVQTADYARTIMRDGPIEMDEAQIEEYVRIRLERQKLLTGDNPIRLRAILDEAVLHRMVGGPEVMTEQIRHVSELAQLPRVSVQVLPYVQGAHPGMSGPFTILKFPEPLSPDAAYVENIAGQLVLEAPADVDRFRVAFERLQSMALSPADTLSLLSERLGSLT